MGGGRASHVAILVRAFNIPTVLATGTASRNVKDGDEIILDGSYGEVYVRPDLNVAQMLDERFALWQEHEGELKKMVDTSHRDDRWAYHVAEGKHPDQY